MYIHICIGSFALAVSPPFSSCPQTNICGVCVCMNVRVCVFFVYIFIYTCVCVLYLCVHTHIAWDSRLHICVSDMYVFIFSNFFLNQVLNKKILQNMQVSKFCSTSIIWKRGRNEVYLYIYIYLYTYIYIYIHISIHICVRMAAFCSARNLSEESYTKRARFLCYFSFWKRVPYKISSFFLVRIKVHSCLAEHEGLNKKKESTQIGLFWSFWKTVPREKIPWCFS